MRKLLLLFIFISSSLGALQAQNSWLQKTNYGGGNRDGAIGFAIGNTGYILCGSDTGDYLTDMWAWTPATDMWTEVTPYYGGRRIGLSCVAMNGYAYVIGGGKPSNCLANSNGGVCGGGFYKDIWRYNPDSDNWTSIDTNFPGTARDYAVAVADPDNSTIYYGTGNDASPTFLSDWWSYCLTTQKWTKLKGFPGGQRINAVGFFLNGHIYVGSGDNNTVNASSNDLWEFIPGINRWKEAANIPMALNGATAFTIGNYGYVCLGASDTSYTTTGWRYNPVTNSWLQIASYPGEPQADGVGFSIGEKGYIGTGIQNTNYLSYFWEYTSDSALGLPPPALPYSISLYPNPANNVVNFSFTSLPSFPAKLSIINLLGKEISSITINSANSLTSLDVSTLSPGLYLYQLTVSGKSLKVGKFIIAR